MNIFEQVMLTKKQKFLCVFFFKKSYGLKIQKSLNFFKKNLEKFFKTLKARK